MTLNDVLWILVSFLFIGFLAWWLGGIDLEDKR